MRPLFSLAFCLFLGVAARAETPTLGLLPRGAKLLLEDGRLRAVDSQGRTRWKLTRAAAKIAGDGTGQVDFRRDSVIFSGDKRLFALRGDQAAQIRDLATAKIRFSAPLYSAPSFPKGETKARFRLAGWQLRPATLPGAATFVTGMAFSPDGRHFALCGWKNLEENDGIDGFPGTIRPFGRVRVFRVSDGKVARDFDISGAHIQSARWSSNFRILTRSGDGRTRVFRLR